MVKKCRPTNRNITKAIQNEHHPTTISRKDGFSLISWKTHCSHSERRKKILSKNKTSS
jgi:hypothetical protein